MAATKLAQDYDIGQRLRTARKVKNLSQRELARKSGVTNGLISQIEQNQTNPTISSLKRILDAIPMNLAEFFSEELIAEPKVFFRAGDMTEVNLSRLIGRDTIGGEISFRQVGNTTRHNIQMLYERYAPGADTGAEMYTHEGEEAGLVIAGEIEVTVDTEACLLAAGDGYVFDSSKPHRFRNTGEVECILVSACTPPTF